MEIEELKEIEARATPRPWKWWTSCSWRRLMGDSEGSGKMVAEPTIARSDHHPDIVISDADMKKIETACNHFAALLDVAERVKDWMGIEQPSDDEDEEIVLEKYELMRDSLRYLEAVK